MATRKRSRRYEKNFYATLKKVRALRLWAVKKDIDPWAFRQALIIAMAIDTACALEKGVKPKDLAGFDEESEAIAQEFIDSIPKEVKAHRW